MSGGEKRVLIMSASAGTGHVRAGDALAKVFGEHPAIGEVRHIDALRFTNKLFRDFYSQLYARLITAAPLFLGWWYDTSDEPWRTDAARHAFDRLNTGPLVKLIRQFDPHITVCTHFMPAGIISHLISRGQLDARLSIVVTDFDFHAMWLSRIFQRYFVAIDETREYLVQLGFPPERITVSGIPVDPAFARPVDRAEVLRGLGLEPGRTTLLVSGGALGVGPAESVVGQLRKLRHDAQFVVVCGRSEELRRRVLEVAGGESGRVRVLGYTDRMHELMRACDLFLGKPGGLTVSEALVCGLPMVIITPIPGQEERNADHLLEQGIAIRCNELLTLAYKVDRLLDDPEKLAGMRERAAGFARPDAARAVVETLVNDRLPTLEISRRKRDEIAQAAGPP